MVRLPGENQRILSTALWRKIMAKTKTAWMLEQEQSMLDDDYSLRQFAQELRAFREEFEQENNLAEERADERARQRISVW
jgi:hypothetical protein